MQAPAQSIRNLNSSPSSTTMPKPKINFGAQNNFSSILQSKPTRFRRTDHTDEKYSEVSSSQVHNNQYQTGNGYGRTVEEGEQNRDIRPQGLAFQVLSEKQEMVIELRERLKNIHHFYKIRIQQQRSKNIERNQIFISIIEQLQRSHNQKIIGLQKSLQALQAEKQQIGVVDQRMGEIKSTIQDILQQSKDLKQDNQLKQKQILRIQVSTKEKEVKCITVQEQRDALRQRLEQFQKLRLKENRRMKELVDMVDSAHQSSTH